MARETTNNGNGLSPWTQKKRPTLTSSYKNNRSLRIFTYGDGKSRIRNGIFRGHDIEPERRVYQKNGIYAGTNIYKINGKWYNDSGEEITKFRSPTSNAKPKQPASGNSTGKRNPVATAPRNNFSTPTPTYYTNFLGAINGFKLDEDLQKYLNSLNVNSVKELLEKLNTDLGSGLVADNRWGNKTQDAFKAGYEKWRLQQTPPTERPLSPFQFDTSLVGNLFRQYALQSLRQSVQPIPVQPIPATYDRYDIRHILKEAGAKGVTAGGRKALRHWANEGTIDPRYLGIINAYGNLFKPQQQQLTPTMDSAWLDYLNNMMGQSYLNLGNTGSSDDMYLYSDGSNLPQQTTSTSSWLPKPEGYWTNKALELGNQFKFTPSSSFLKKGGYIPKLQTAWRTITDMRNYIPSQNQTPNLPGSVVVAKTTTRIRNEENRKKDSADKRKTKVSGAKDMQKMNIMDLLDLLWLKGFFEGTGFTYDQAVDGIIGRRTRQAMEKAKNSGYTVTLGLKMKKTPLGQSQSKKEVNKENNVTRTSFGDMIGSTLDYLFPSRIRNREEEEALRNSTNFDAVRRAKAHNNVKEPYWYFDPKDNVAYRMLGDRILDKFEIGSGLNLTSDGFTDLVRGYDRSKNLSSTGAGVFTLLKLQDAYLYNNEPVYLFKTADGKPTNQAWHGAATPERKLLLGDNNERNNKVSFGCIYGPDGVLRCFDEKGQVHSGDSAYIEPKLDENYFYYDMNDGKIKTHFENMPSRVRGKNYSAEYDLNNVRYNTSY